MKAKARSRRASANRDMAAAAALAALVALFSGAAAAKSSDRQQPMNYTAKRTNAFNAPNTVSTLSGNVKITQGSLVLTGNEAKIHLDGDSQIARVVVTGNPAHIQQLDDHNNLMTGDSKTLDFDNIRGIAVLTTNAVVKQKGRGEFRGDKLTYNTETSQITGESSGTGMVSGTFMPKAKPQPAKTPAASGQGAAPQEQR